MFKTDLAYDTWKKKYQFNNERPIETFQRVARALASVEKEPEQEEWYEKFLSTIVKFDASGNPVGLKCTPGGRITANAGTSYKKATLLNCYVSGPVSGAQIQYTRKSKTFDLSYDVKYKSDDSPDDLINIFLTIVEQAKTLASEGGYGLNFDFIRPRGSIIKGTGILHPGVVSYMKIWDSVAECIVKGTSDGYVDKLKNYLKDDAEFEDLKRTMKSMTRKGAMMAALSCSHPDIEEFIRCKQSSGVLTKFNISVLISDDFMEAVEKDEFYDLTFGGRVYKKIKARELYDLIMKSCYNRAEPGVLFVDNMHRNNPLAYLGKCTCTNPCLHGDSLFLTQKGLMPIVDLVGKTETIWNGIEWTEAKFFYTGIKPVYEVRLSDGSSIKATEDHRFSSEGETVQLRETLGKKIDRFVGMNWKGRRIALTGEELVCLGYIFGNGYFNKASNRYKHVDVSDQDKEIKELFRKIGEALKDVDFNGKKILSPTVSNKCKDLGLPETSYPYRYFSQRLLTLPPDQMQQFLCGLYSARGFFSLEERKIVLKCSSEKFIAQLQIILMSLGIKSYSFARDYRNPDDICKGLPYGEDYSLNIVSEDVETFMNKIGFVQERKRNILPTADDRERKLSQAEVISIRYIGMESVYDFSEPQTNWAFVNGFKTHNCGEVPGLDSLTTVCLLGSLNLTQYVERDDDGNPFFDYDSYGKDVTIFTRMLDNVNDLTYNAIPSFDWTTKNLRQIGVGLNGAGSALFMLGKKYSSEEAVEFIEELCHIKENLTWQASAHLAAEKGAFPAYDKEAFESTEYFNSERLTEETKQLLRDHGARNGKTTTNPPLGNSSVLCDNISNGIEPVYSLEYERTIICKDWPQGLHEENVRSELKKFKGKDFTYWKGPYNGQIYYYEPQNRGLCEVHTIRDFGYQWLLDNYPEKDHGSFLVTTGDLNIEDHLKVQAAVQANVNQSVSKTSNLPEDYPFEDFKELYFKAWKHKLVGFTTYREGSMESVLTDIDRPGASKEVIKKDIKLPETFLNGPCRIIKKEGKKFYIHFSYLPGDNEYKFPFCMWIYSNAKYKEKDDLKICNKASRQLALLAHKSGINDDIIQEALQKASTDYPHNRLGRMISLNLRHNVPRVSILVSLMDIDGDNVSTLLTAVRHFIEETLDDGTELKGLRCKSCNSTRIFMEGGCKRCKDCGGQMCG